MSQKRILLVSDGTGETAAAMIKAAMVQFSDQDVQIVRHKNIRSESQIDPICTDALQDTGSGKALIVFTLVSPQLRALLLKKCADHQLPAVDLLGPLLRGLGSHFGFEPKAIAGLLHDVNEEYFQRIDAMEFTIAHDDGRDLTDLDRADLVILGISRTSKTPLSMYLSHQGWKVANIPLIKGIEVPREVFELDQKRVIGLTIDAHDLLVIRRARLERLGHDRGGEYADPDKVIEEIEYANELFRRNRRWPIFNVTGKALEETASEIIKLMASRRLTPHASLENIPPTVSNS
ncbi:MAG: pyruvate, water dikinase regulatory protein [Oligoflexia bacterium]|jgi:regulator of PEP synthase PpsR (kinase-PPPase family)